MFFPVSYRFAPVLLAAWSLSLIAATPPAVGQKAPDFALSNVEGKTLRLSELTSNGPVALIVLRGYPGYQCPFCNRQAQDFAHNAQSFAQVGLRVVMVYPGPPENLNGRASEFLADKAFPSSFEMLLDPGYAFTNLYGLRWAAPRETAYPSTFLIDKSGVVFFAKISKEHGGRSTAAELLEVYSKQKGGK